MRVAVQRIPAPTATMLAMLSSLPIAVAPALVFHSGEMLTQPLKSYAWFALMGAMAYPVAFMFLNVSIKLVGAARAAPFSSVQPVFAFALGATFLGERPGLLVALGTPVIVAGLALVLTSRASSLNTQGWARSNAFGYLLAIGSSATFASRDVISRHVVSDLAPSLVASAYSLSMGAVMLLALILPRAAGSFRGVPARYPLMCILTGIGQGIAVVSLFQALSRAPVTVVSPILATSSLFVLLFAHQFLGRMESITLPLVFGALLTVTGVVLVVLGAAG